MNFPVIFLTLATIMLGVGLLGMAVFGVRNIIEGKHGYDKILIVIIPGLIFLGAYLFAGEWTEAGLLTMMISMGIIALMITVNGLRNTFNF